MKSIGQRDNVQQMQLSISCIMLACKPKLGKHTEAFRNKLMMKLLDFLSCSLLKIFGQINLRVFIIYMNVTV